ncbi:hypothetical protein HMPREF0262_03321 [Clostridium sp. ATCC 29733]|nr:hypothetical protein HMPREF0262_03321 [Clostridium sp. ATCC 29733]
MRRVRGCGPRQKQRFPPPLPMRKSSLSRAKNSSVEQLSALPSTLCSYSQTGSPQREKRDNRKSSRGLSGPWELFCGLEQRNITFCAAGMESV